MICGNLLLSGATKEALKSGLSDMEYLRSKVATTDDTLEEEDGEGGDDEDEDRGPVQHTDSAYESGDRENTSKAKTPASSEEKKQSKAKKTAKQEVTDQSTLNIILLFWFSMKWFTPSCVRCRWSRLQSSPWSWEESRSMLKRWVNKFWVKKIDWSHFKKKKKHWHQHVFCVWH